MYFLPVNLSSCHLELFCTVPKIREVKFLKASSRHTGPQGLPNFHFHLGDFIDKARLSCSCHAHDNDDKMDFSVNLGRLELKGQKPPNIYGRMTVEVYAQPTTASSEFRSDDTKRVGAHELADMREFWSTLFHFKYFRHSECLIPVWGRDHRGPRIP